MSLQAVLRSFSANNLWKLLNPTFQDLEEDVCDFEKVFFIFAK